MVDPLSLIYLELRATTVANLRICKLLEEKIQIREFAAAVTWLYQTWSVDHGDQSGLYCLYSKIRKFNDCPINLAELFFLIFLLNR